MKRKYLLLVVSILTILQILICDVKAQNLTQDIQDLQNNQDKIVFSLFIFFGGLSLVIGTGLVLMLNSTREKIHAIEQTYNLIKSTVDLLQKNVDSLRDMILKILPERTIPSYERPSMETQIRKQDIDVKKEVKTQDLGKVTDLRTEREREQEIGNKILNLLLSALSRSLEKLQKEDFENELKQIHANLLKEDEKKVITSYNEIQKKIKDLLSVLNDVEKKLIDRGQLWKEKISEPINNIKQEFQHVDIEIKGSKVELPLLEKYFPDSGKIGIDNEERLSEGVRKYFEDIKQQKAQYIQKHQQSISQQIDMMRNSIESLEKIYEKIVIKDIVELIILIDVIKKQSQVFLYPDPIKDLLKVTGLEEIKANKYDPEVHELADNVIRTNLLSGDIDEVRKKGFMYKGKLLKKALVVTVK